MAESADRLWGCSRRKIGRSLAALVALSALASSAPCGEGPAAPAPVDAVFLVDSSASLFRSDPARAREALVEVFSGYALWRPGDRVAVAQFAGWEETRARVGEVLFPLKEIPAEPEARAALVDEIRARLDGARALGSATDPNAAVELALAEVERAAGPREGRKTWAILLTDGDVDVVEGESARQEYVDKAQEMFGHAGPDALARAAGELFFTKSLPALLARGVKVSMAGLGRSPEKPGWFFQRAASTDGVDVLHVGGPLLRESLLRLTELSPLAEAQRSISYDASQASCAPGGVARVPIRALPGTRNLRAVVFATSPAFDLSVARPDGNPLERPQLNVFGDGKTYRVAWFRGVEPGTYDLMLKSRADAPVSFEVVVSAEVPLRLKVDWPPAPSMHLVGLPLILGAAIAGPGGEPVGDPRVLEALRVVLEARSGEKTSTAELALRGRKEGAFTFEAPISGFGPGRCEVSATLEAYPAPAGSFLFTSAPESHEFELQSGAMVQFARKEAWVGQAVAMKGELSAETTDAPAELEVRLEPERTVALSRVASGGYGGSVSFDKPGTWKVVRSSSGPIQVVPGAAGELTVRERTLRLLSPAPPHPELASLDFAVSYREKTEGEPYELPVLIEMSCEPDEPRPALLPPSFKSAEAAAKLKVAPALAFSAGALEPHGSGKGRFATTLRLGVRTEEELPAEPGTAELAAAVGSGKASKALPVRLTFPNYWERLLVIYMKYWVPAAALLAVLLLWLLWWLTRARFKEHQIHPIRAGVAGFYKLRNLGGRRNAVGTPEVENAVRFRIRGNRIIGRGRVKVRALDDARIAVNGEEREGWVRLRHGDDVKVYGPADVSCLYWYFEREPTGEELEAKRQAYVITLGPDEFVIEDMDDSVEGGTA